MAYTLTYTINQDGNSYTLSGHSGDEPTGELIIPDSYNSKPVTKIGNTTFSSCIKLTSVIIPDSIISIGVNAFAFCDVLTSVTIGKNSQLTSIGASAFINCYCLTSIVIPNSVTSIGNSAFHGCRQLTSVILSDSITSIGNSVFNSCTSLTSITIPNSVTSIGDTAFNNCTHLTSVTLSESITSIGVRAFNNCTSLTSIMIPGSVTSIGDYAFNSCSQLTKISMLSTTPPTIQSSTLITTIQKIYVPSGSGESYKTATNWNSYSDIITEFPLLDLSSLLIYNDKVKEKIASVTTELENKIKDITFDSTPTEGSSNPVTSEGIKSYVDSAIASAITDALNTAI